MDETCPTCGGTGIDKNTVWTPALVEGVDFEWCPICDGTGEIEIVCEYDLYENADEWYDTRCDRW